MWVNCDVLSIVYFQDKIEEKHANELQDLEVNNSM